MNSQDYAARIVRSYDSPDRPAVAKFVSHFPVKVLQLVHGASVRLELIPNDEHWPMDVPVGFDRASGIYISNENLVAIKSPQAAVIGHVFGHVLDHLAGAKLDVEGPASESATKLGQQITTRFDEDSSAGHLPTKLAGNGPAEYVAELLRANYGFLAPRFPDPLNTQRLTRPQKQLVEEILATLDLSLRQRIAI